MYLGDEDHRDDGSATTSDIAESDLACRQGLVNTNS